MRHIDPMQYPRFWLKLTGVSLLLIAAAAGSVSAQAQEKKSLTEAQRMEIAVEALSRIQGDIRTNAELKAAVYKLLGKVQGKPQFVQIVKKFQLKDHDEGLLDCAVKSPTSESGVEAMRLILENGNLNLITNAVNGTDSAKGAKVVEALGRTGEKRVVPLLLPMVTEEKRDGALRRMAVKALAQSQEGAKELLELAKQDKLPQDLKLVATTELNAVRWQKIQAEAAKVLPPPQGQNAQPLPPISALLKLNGDAARGEAVFFREQSVCSKCHRIKGRGGEIGPDLSEIGTKLGKDALFEAIIDPSAGISFGFEANTLELKSGDEAYGLVVSDTESEISIKDLNGLVTHYKKSDVVSRKQLKTSIMPTGLPSTMTPQELADLVGFLSNLKKAN